MPDHHRTRRHLARAAAKGLMEALGSRVDVITEPDPIGGFLGARIAYVRTPCASDERYVWLGQYTNQANRRAHYRTTAPAIARERRLRVRIVAVDSVGSVAFGGAPGRRLIPGLGTSVTPPLLDPSWVDDVVRVEEADIVRACHRLARRGFLLGGSTGTVVSGAVDWLDRNGSPDVTAVAIAPDLGERYLDTIYRPGWPLAQYGEAFLGTDELGTGELAAPVV